MKVYKIDWDRAYPKIIEEEIEDSSEMETYHMTYDKARDHIVEYFQEEIDLYRNLITKHEYTKEFKDL